MVTVLAVRHADIDLPPSSADPALSPARRERAIALARLVGESGISAIFMSQFVRTRQTVEPLADLLGMTPQLTPEPSEWAESARSGQFGPVLIVAGHSNTVPEILASLGAASPPAIGERAFDNLFVLTTLPEYGAGLLHLRYGAPR